MKMTNNNKITNTKVGDDIHFYINGNEDRGIVVKMNNEYVTVFKESTQEYDDIHINDTFFIKDILVNKEWDKMEDNERYEALVKIHAPSPRYMMKSWDSLPKEIKELLTKNNAIETSHKEGKDDDMNHVGTRNWDDSVDKGLGGTERATDPDSEAGEKIEGTSTNPDSERGGDGSQNISAGDMKQGKKHKKERIETNPEIEPDKHGHGKRSESHEEDKLGQGSKGSKNTAGVDYMTEGGAGIGTGDVKLGEAAKLQDAKYQKQQMDKKREVRGQRRSEQTDKVPKKVTEGMSKLKAWQLWLAKREQEIMKKTNRQELVEYLDDKERGGKASKDEIKHHKETSQAKTVIGSKGRGSMTESNMEKWKSWLDEQKSNTERSIHGNAGRNPNAGVNTNTGFDAPKDYEGFSHSGIRPEQFKHERKKPKVTNKERVNIGSTAPPPASQGTGDGGNPYNTKTQNKDKKGRAEGMRDRN